MFGRGYQQPHHEAAPVIEKTPEQLADEVTAARAEWEERNPLRRWLITFMDGTEQTVTAHYYSDGLSFSSARVLFMRIRYGVPSPYKNDHVREVVYWTHSELIRSVEMVED